MIVEAIFKNNLILAEQRLEEKMKSILKEKLLEFKKMVLAKEAVEEEPITEAINNVQKMGRVKLIRLRVRNGKVQRRKKLSAVKGYTLRAGRVQRMSATERRHRKLGARRAKIKRKSKRARINLKLHRSLRKRHNLGL